ncbi:MAG: hypothetical protein PXY39_09345 [archaeon]|nr:hypothetical protein [archaeon]
MKIEERPNDNERDLESFRREELRRKVEGATSYDDLFESVKRVVESEIGRHRAGLALVLTDMPNTVGAFHPVGSNSIVLNRALINAMRVVIKNQKEINSFVFMVLMHEYLHSLGYLDEIQVRKIAHQISKRAFGAGHLTARMAIGNWLEMYPQISMVVQKLSPNSFERIDKFDSSSMRYIG